MVNAVQLYHHLTCITNCISIYLYSLCWSRNLDGFGSVEISSMKASKSRDACVFFVFPVFECKERYVRYKDFHIL